MIIKKKKTIYLSIAFFFSNAFGAESDSSDEYKYVVVLNTSNDFYKRGSLFYSSGEMNTFLQKDAKKHAKKICKKMGWIIVDGPYFLIKESIDNYFFKTKEALLRREVLFIVKEKE